MTDLRFSVRAILAAVLISAGWVLTAAEKPLPALSAKEQALLERLGGKLEADGNILLGGIRLDRRTKEISFPAVTNIREGSIEVLVTTEAGRCHESLLITKIDPFMLQLTLYLAGFRNGPLHEGTPIPRGAVFDLSVRLPDGKEEKLVSWLANASLQRAVPDCGVVFIGSNFREGKCLATVEGNLANINSNDNNSILNLCLDEAHLYDEYVAVPANIVKAPHPEKTLDVPVTVLLRPRKIDPAAVKAVAENAPEVKTAATPDYILKKVAEIKFTGREIRDDFPKLRPVLLQQVPADKPEAAKKILDAKIAIMKRFLDTYPKLAGDTYYDQVKATYEKTRDLRALYE